MKRKFLLLLFTVINVIFAQIQARQITYTDQHHNLVFNVVDEVTKTCEFIRPAENISGELVIPEEVSGYTVIGIANNALSSCVDMTSVRIPETITYIGAGAFNGCESLTSLTLPNSIEVLNNEIFTECRALKIIYLGNSTKIIGDNFFDGAPNLESINVSPENNNFASIEGCLFNKDLSRLIRIPACNPNVYNEPTWHVTYDIPETVKSIANFAFNNCYGLECVRIGKNVEDIGNRAFVSCNRLKYITVDVNNKVYSDFEGTLYNKGLSILIRHPECNTNIKFPVSIKEIGSYAFEACYFDTIALPNTVSKIDSFAFYNLWNSVSVNPWDTKYGLKKIIIPTNIESIEEHAFSNNPYIENIIYLGSLPVETNKNIFDDSIYNSAVLYTPIDSSMSFHQTSSWNQFKNIVEGIPDNIEQPNQVLAFKYEHDGQLLNYTITDSDNYTCKIGMNFNISGNVVIPEKAVYLNNEYTVTSISERAFNECIDLSKISISPTIITIGNEAFKDCDNIREIVIEDGKEIINLGESVFPRTGIPFSIYIGRDFETRDGYPLFNNNLSLTEVNIGNKVTDIPIKTFYRCRNLSKINLGNSLKYIGRQAFTECPIKEIRIPESVSVIDNAAFRKCSLLRDIELPGSLTSLGATAFEECSSLDHISIPRGVSSIGNYAFTQCPAIKSIEYLSNDPIEANSNIFDNEVYSNAKLIIPEGCESTFKEVCPWNIFSTIEEQIGTGIYMLDINDSDYKASFIDLSIPFEIYDLNGIRVGNSMTGLKSGTYIIKSESSNHKIIIN